MGYIGAGLALRQYTPIWLYTGLALCIAGKSIFLYRASPVAIYSSGNILQFISKIGMKLWFYRCCFTPLEVSTLWFLPFTDSLCFNVLVSTEVCCFTLEGLYLGSNLVRSWQYKKTRRRIYSCWLCTGLALCIDSFNLLFAHTHLVQAGHNS